jgi:FtsP/CotA-like multicopper oxidase with cupredoxin domain
LGLPPLGRRAFFADAGGLFLCTLAGQKVFLDHGADVEELAAGVKVPPKVAAAQSNGTFSSAQPHTVLAAVGGRREYWIQAEAMSWDIVPDGRDAMMAKKVKGKTKFGAYGYRAYTAGFADPIGPAQIPGPLIEAEIGDTVVVHFRNKLDVPVTIHPHGILYSDDMDGAYKGKFTDPGGFVQKNATFDYTWEATAGTEGFWFYHDHGPMDPLPLYKGLFGPMIIRKPGETPPAREFFIAFHSFQPVTTGIDRAFYCINGHAYAGNTPTIHSSVGDDVAFYVYAIDDNFHTFHIHGHRWTDPNGGKVIDNATLGPGDSITARFIEDNPGRWFYHCHVFSHLHEGMNGWYLVS